MQTAALMSEPRAHPAAGAMQAFSPGPRPKEGSTDTSSSAETVEAVLQGHGPALFFRGQRGGAVLCFSILYWSILQYIIPLFFHPYVLSVNNHKCQTKCDKNDEEDERREGGI